MTVHSIDGKQETTQLDRIGRLAKEKKETIFNNVGPYIPQLLSKEIVFFELYAKELDNPAV